MNDSEKLNKLAEWLDIRDNIEIIKGEGTIYADLRRIAKDIATVDKLVKDILEIATYKPSDEDAFGDGFDRLDQIQKIINEKGISVIIRSKTG